MKTISLIILSMLYSSLCASQKPVQITPQEQEDTKKEIREAVRVIFQNLEKMDVEALFQSYSNSSNLIFFTTDGSKTGLHEAKNHHAAWFESLSSLKVTNDTDDFRFLPGNVVICSWLGKFEMTLVSGEHLKINKFGITFIFSKIDNLWTVIYQHSSALTPTQ